MTTALAVLKMGARSKAFWIIKKKQEIIFWEKQFRLN